MPERIQTLSEILINYDSLGRNFVNNDVLRNCQRSKDIISRELTFWGTELKRSAVYNQYLWEQISQALKAMSDDDIEKRLIDEAKGDINLKKFLKYVKKDGWIPLKPDHGYGIEEVLVNYCFYNIAKKKFFMWGKLDEDINSDPYTLGYLAHKGLIDIECLNPERVLKNFKKE